MKSLSEKIKWYREPETRKWKRIWHCMELSLNALLAMAVLIVMQIYGDGSKLQYPLALFTIGVALSSACLAPSVFQSVIFKRWQIQVVTLGLGCGMGISALAALAILELQIGST